MDKFQCTKENVEHCKFSAWYPTFKHLTIRSEIIPLTDDEVAYLRADGLVMPEGCSVAEYGGPVKSDSDDSDREDWQHDEAHDGAEAPRLPRLIEQIDCAVAKLGGEVCPKLNWSAPRDATWISYDGTLRCKSANDVFLLLKASDFVTHDLHQPYKYCSDCDDIEEASPNYELVLRRWRTVIPGMEFRCFVRNHQLVGVCQRDHSAFYDYLSKTHRRQSEGDYEEFVARQQEDLKTEIHRFFTENISGKFCDPDYVVDVYRRDKDKFWLIDFNPFSAVTDALLFSWEELAASSPNGHANGSASTEEASTASAAEVAEAAASLMFEFRINRQEGVQPSPYLSHRVPKDIVDLSTGEDINKFVDLFQSKNLGQDSDSD